MTRLDITPSAVIPSEARDPLATCPAGRGSLAALRALRALRRFGMTWLMLVVAFFLLSSCGFFSRSQSRFYSIDRVPPAAPVTATAPGLPIGIDAMQLPPGFDRREVVVRKGDRQLDVRSAHQWSANLEALVLHTLASNLADRLPVGRVVLPGQVRPTGAARGLDVVFEELAAGPENALVADVRWVVRESGRADVAHHDRFTVDLPSLDSEQVAAGMTAALGELADRMAARLR